MSITFYDSYRFPYPSKNKTIETIVQTDPYPVGLAVDSINDHIYLVEYPGNKLLRCNLDGSNVIVLATLRNPHVIRLDIANRY